MILAEVKEGEAAVTGDFCLFALSPKLGLFATHFTTYSLNTSLKRVEPLETGPGNRLGRTATARLRVEILLLVLRHAAGRRLGGGEGEARGWRPQAPPKRS
jgi:hypothetical protein